MHKSNFKVIKLFNVAENKMVENISSDVTALKRPSRSSEENAFNKVQRKKLKRRFYLISLGVVLLFSGYSAVISLQSSINITDGAGTRSISTTYVTQVFVSFFIAPFLLRLLSPKVVLIISECCYLVYVAANFFPSTVTLTIGSIFAAFAEALFWVPVAICFVHFGKEYHKYSDQPEVVCLMLFNGILFGMFMLNQILGNTFVFLILHFLTSSSHGNQLEITKIENTSLMPALPTVTESTYTSMAELSVNPFQFCGANDCQDPNVTKSNITQYVPSNPVALYALLGCFVAVMLSGIVIHFLLVPDISLKTLNKQSYKPSNKQSAEEVDLATINHVNTENEGNLRKIFHMTCSAIKDSFIMFFHPLHLLVAPMMIYFGLDFAFVISEATRSLASCALGVSQVGSGMITFASFNALTCYISGRHLGKYGPLTLVIVGMIFDLIAQIIMLSWTPIMDALWVIYLLFSLWGISNALWQVSMAATYGSDIYKTKEVSFSLWCVCFALGMAIETSIGGLLCVRQKIYILMSWLIIAIGLFTLHARKSRKRFA
ncbi:protein unc-93 homolog A-like [Clavelina lepadiformis]|uniref:protein unc-93 homolog A-like n=1 Tax=Clavelina lepadiformis TaxID=159417 RepID=UPI0040429FBE